MKAVYKRELASYFNSMIGYVYTFIVLIFIAFMFYLDNMTAGYSNSSATGGYPYFSGALSSSLIILVLTVPILTMKSMAEERRSKTDQMLLTLVCNTSYHIKSPKSIEIFKIDRFGTFYVI